jgi:Tol biopolymer transport system component
MQEELTHGERIYSWKEIGAYLGRDARTVIRWEKEKGLPVHRVPGGQRKGVFAFRRELDAWLAGQFNDQDVTNGTGKQVPGPMGQPSATHSSEAAVSVADLPLPAAGLLMKSARSGSQLWWGRGGIIAAVTLAGCALIAVMFALLRSPTVLMVSNPTPVTRSHTRILSPLLRDGDHVLYQRYENGRYSVASVPVEGGDNTDVKTDLKNPELCDFTPDGQRLLLRDLINTRDELNPVYIQPEGGKAERTGDFQAYDAAWFPDGKSILYSVDGTVYASDTAGTSRKQLFRVPGNAYWFRWSPDGKRFRFTVIDKGTEQTSIWEAKPDGSGPHRLFPEVRDLLCCGSWTGDGKFFIFQARAGNRFEIWAARDHDGILGRIHNRPFPLITGAVNYRGPLPDQDGKKLFVRAEAPKGELVRFDKKSGEFLPVAPSISVRTLAYSKDGNWAAYTSLTDKNLWRCRADGTQCLQLTRGFKDTVLPRWSPHGKTIAFMGIGFTGAWAVYSVPANGGPVRPLSHNPWATGYPDWSPDGQKLAFSEVPPLSQPRGIYLLDLHSGHVTELPGSSSYFFPRWSPDGHSIVALHAADQYLYLYDFRSKKWRPLVNAPSCYPNWSHDGKDIYFLPLSSGDRAVLRVTAANGTVDKVADLTGIERGPFFMGDWTGLAPDDSPLAVRNSTIEDIFAWDMQAQ